MGGGAAAEGSGTAFDVGATGTAVRASTAEVARDVAAACVGVVGAERVAYGALAICATGGVGSTSCPGAAVGDQVVVGVVDGSSRGTGADVPTDPTAGAAVQPRAGCVA
jgi:hypothetical protein